MRACSRIKENLEYPNTQAERRTQHEDILMRSCSRIKENLEYPNTQAERRTQHEVH